MNGGHGMSGIAISPDHQLEKEQPVQSLNMFNEPHYLLMSSSPFPTSLSSWPSLYILPPMWVSTKGGHSIPT